MATFHQNDAGFEPNLIAGSGLLETGVAEYKILSTVQYNSSIRVDNDEHELQLIGLGLH
ncbi:hypothetical protein Csa_014238 [Cucumis sativus]|uniref:Uncharacterized protein n=1 Tax=Cucumis sativus TaxID=3659 RepID=A0A0A0LX22_CUCSA|nr:hypothetical protein Csa_014238 [Cucumis sativus]